MEIYTTDLITIAQEYADKIEQRCFNEPLNKYVIEDECCDLQSKIRRLIYERLSIEFRSIIDRSKREEIDLERELFKTINDL